MTLYGVAFLLRLQTSSFGGYRCITQCNEPCFDWLTCCRFQRAVACDNRLLLYLPEHAGTVLCGSRIRPQIP